MPVERIEHDHYVCEKQKYFLNFPFEWAITMAPGSGPKFCENCKKHGIVDDIFIGYCSDCAIYMYDNKRGHGFINGKEDINIMEKETSASYTYLKYTKHAFPLYNINKPPIEIRQIKNSFSEISIIISEKTRSKSSETSNDSRSTSVNSELSFRLSS